MCRLTNALYTEVDILIVEDEIVLAMAIEMSLQDMEYNVSGIETTGHDAIEHAKLKRPDIILMDIHLNNSISGIEAASQIWKSFKIPIVFLTSYYDDKTMRDTMECEPYGYLIKPCKDEDLKVTITMALHKHKYFYQNKQNFINTENKFIFITEFIKFDRSTSNLFNKSDKIQLTKNEKKLFEVMTENYEEVTSFHKIFTYIWRENINDMGKLRTLLYRIRLKLGVDPFENIFEEGYKIRRIKTNV